MECKHCRGIYREESEFPAIEAIDLEYYEKLATPTEKAIYAPYTVVFLEFTYNGGGKAADDNRTASRKAYKGIDYDGKLINRHEIPYATTEEGGARAYSQLTSAVQNQMHGTALGMFYLRNHMKEGDKFLVPLHKNSTKPIPVPTPLPLLKPKSPNPGPVFTPWSIWEILEGLGEFAI